MNIDYCPKYSNTLPSMEVSESGGMQTLSCELISSMGVVRSKLNVFKSIQKNYNFIIGFIYFAVKILYFKSPCTKSTAFLESLSSISRAPFSTSNLTIS